MQTSTINDVVARIASLYPTLPEGRLDGQGFYYRFCLAQYGISLYFCKFLVRHSSL